MTKSRLWVYSGDRPSNGAKELATHPGFLRLRTNRFHKVKPKDFIINWGCSSHPVFPVANYVQHAAAISFATNKLAAFMCLSSGDVQTVEWTGKKSVALEWLASGATVVCRKKLTGHSGDGIIIVEKNTAPENMPDAPLYTKYVYKVKEFRVHVCNDKVIDTQQKIKDPEREVENWKVRSHANGFIFARNNIVPSVARDELARAAISALGLDFGAVDIIEDKNGLLYVLEINTAPGLEGQTIKSYAEALSGYQS
jgi:glutathione synthase/RimK-type ligase-like ATP-grasp enzyme